MSPLELIDRVYSPDADWPVEPPPVEVLVNGRETDHSFSWMTYQASVASLAGDWLDTAATTEDAREAIEHGMALHGAGLIDDDDVYARGCEIIRQVKSFCEEQQEQARRAGALRDRWGLCGQSLN